MNKRIALLFVFLLTALAISGCAPGGEVQTVVVTQMVEPEGELIVETVIVEVGPDYEYSDATEEPMEEPAYIPPPPQSPGVQSPPIAPGQPPSGMYFQDYGTNPFIIAAQDNLSTFAVDVDTGSYTLARSYLNDGNLPPPEAIRLEEFVNYFEQDYPNPQQEVFGITMDAAPTPFTHPSGFVMRVGVQGYEPPESERPDALLIFVIDTSGSMDMENRLGAVKAALRTLVEELRPTDRVGIVTYGSRGQVMLNPTVIDDDAAILRVINSLRPGGSTNAEEGLRLAYEMATAYGEDGAITRLILCSDGVANVGNTGPNSILNTVRRQAADGINLTTVGFGMGNYNDVLMEQLADDGDGQYYYVDTQAEAERVFVDDLTGTLLTIGRDAKIQVEFSTSNVAAYRLLGYENRDVADEDFRDDNVDAGEIGAGHSVTALYEVFMVDDATGVLATTRLRWEDPDSGEIIEIYETVDTDDVLGSFEEAPLRFQLDTTVAAFADILSYGAWHQNTTAQYVSEMADYLAARLATDGDVAEFADLVSRAQRMGAGR